VQKSKNLKGISQDTKKLLNGAEGRSVDFKIKASGVKPEDFVAFANGSGGTILVGVEEKSDSKKGQSGKVVGCKVDDRTRQSFISSAASCRPSIDIKVRIENMGTDKPIFRIDIPEGTDKPYCTSSGLYKIRVDGQNIAIDPNLMRAIILDEESEKFISRFKSAAEEVLVQIKQVHDDLAARIEEVNNAALQASKAAERAENAAQEATNAARDAEAAAWAS